MYRFHPQNVHALKLVQDGAIGEVREVRAHPSVDIMADAAGNVRFDKALGGGSLLDMGCYAVSAARLFLGEPVAAHGLLRRRPQAPASTFRHQPSSNSRTAAPRSSPPPSRASGQGLYQVIGTEVRSTCRAPSSLAWAAASPKGW